MQLFAGAGAPPEDDLARATAGMRRVFAVHMVEGGRVRFYVEGIGHRFPIRREVTPSVAHSLMRDVPCRHDRPRRVGARSKRS